MSILPVLVLMNSLYLYVRASFDLGRTCSNPNLWPKESILILNDVCSSSEETISSYIKI